ncbi:uncharacterized protein [Macrobrachium rosenbergii]|uniref:uncharacterized protein n=1 Tax=Macrobrachium rosenbergii TaxID=79674 RepID=UPI0034D40FC8
MAVYRSLPVSLAIFLIGLSFSTASVARQRQYNNVLRQVEDRVRSPKGPGKEGPPGDHGPLVGPGGPPVGPGGFVPGVPGGNGTSGVIFGPGGPGFLPIPPTGEKCVSMCEKLEALIDSLEANKTESNGTAANATDPDIPPVMFFVFLFCSNSTADGPFNQTHPGKSGDSSEESGESGESSEESGESGESSEESGESGESSEESGEDGESTESSEESGEDGESTESPEEDSDDADRWISWDQLETQRQGGPGPFHKVCKAYQRLMDLQLIRQTLHNATLFNQTGPLQPVLDYVHEVCQKNGTEGKGNGGGDDDGDDDDDDSRMIRRGPYQSSGNYGNFDNRRGPHGPPMGNPIAEFCEVISIVFQPVGGNITAPTGSEEVTAFFKDMVSCLCNIDLN